MMPVIAIFDIGKTNKKFFLFNEQYKIVLEQTIQFEEIVDEDGCACDDVHQFKTWVMESLQEAIASKKFDIKAINFSTYGASFVHINAEGKPVTPLYNYLKEFPAELKEQFYQTYGGETKISLETASPVLGNLNSGMQLYWLKHARLLQYNSIVHSLHLPQYMSYIFTKQTHADITSIGCHTQLWNFQTNTYHSWVLQEGIIEKLPAVHASNETIAININNATMQCGIGLHDSSAALIPYLTCFTEPFILISTGTWCISLNPFNNEPLTVSELQKDCLCYMEYQGNPVKAARLFAGHEHEQQTKRLGFHFGVALDYYKTVAFDATLVNHTKTIDAKAEAAITVFGERQLTHFTNYEQAYHQLMVDIIQQQYLSTSLILGTKKVKRIFVDGGFGKNPVYMNLLAAAFPAMEVFAASVSQATAIGAALSIHKHWNTKPIPGDMIDLKYYVAADKVDV
jgi:sugar (pentulose or hexulose) kinase